MISNIPVELIEEQLKLVNKLRDCAKNRNFEIVEESIFEFDNRYKTGDGPAMIAVARLLLDEWLVISPEYLNDNQLKIYEFWCSFLEEGDVVYTLSERDYCAIEKYKGAKKLNVSMFL